MSHFSSSKVANDQIRSRCSRALRAPDHAAELIGPRSTPPVVVIDALILVLYSTGWANETAELVAKLLIVS